MSTSGDISKSSTTKCGDIGGGDNDEKKMSTSYEQNNKIGGESSSSSDIDAGSSGKAVSDIDTMSEQLSDNTIADTNTNSDVGKMSKSDFEELLFQDPPPKEDCPVCMQPMPFSEGICGVEKVYMECCGKTFCRGCSLAESKEMMKGTMKPWCPFCRVPIIANKYTKEKKERFKRRLQANDAAAFHYLGNAYSMGNWGIRQNHKKAIELWKRGAELGSCNADASLAAAYMNGEGVAESIFEGRFHFIIAAIGGHEAARHCLGMMERDIAKDTATAMKHFMIAARSGYDDSLKEVGEGYKAGVVTKDEYANTLRAHKEYQDRMKSKEREEAANWRG